MSSFNAVTPTSISTKTEPSRQVQPFVKWAGGKRKLFSELDKLIPSHFNRYFEPFLGAGALFFHLMSSDRKFTAYISDSNAELITAYKVVRDNPKELIELVQKYEYEYKEYPSPQTIEEFRSRPGATWKGDAVEYRSLHDYIVKIYPKTHLCESCKLVAPAELTCIRKYDRLKKNWRWLCVICHVRWLYQEDCYYRLRDLYNNLALYVKSEELQPVMSKHPKYKKKKYPPYSKEQEEYYKRLTDLYFLSISKGQSSIEIATLLIVLNKTCYNGLYRPDKKGEFNAPWGKRNPNICDSSNLENVSNTLRYSETIISAIDYKEVIKYAQKGDFVYLDPPYKPVSRTSNFTSYTPDGFSHEDQVQLADVFRELTDRGCFVLLSNSREVRELYEDYSIKEVVAGRLISCDASKRTGKVLIISNYSNSITQDSRNDEVFQTQLKQESMDTWIISQLDN
jgi:DNA adenine methylase Dam